MEWIICLIVLVVIYQKLRKKVALSRKEKAICWFISFGLYMISCFFPYNSFDASGVSVLSFGWPMPFINVYQIPTAHLGFSVKMDGILLVAMVAFFFQTVVLIAYMAKTDSSQRNTNSIL